MKESKQEKGMNLCYGTAVENQLSTLFRKNNFLFAGLWFLGVLELVFKWLHLFLCKHHPDNLQYTAWDVESSVDAMPPNINSIQERHSVPWRLEKYLQLL